MNKNGRVVWQGKSKFDGKDIVVIVVGFAQRSHNDKTGNLLQTYILPVDTNPYDGLTIDRNKSVCGDCIHSYLNSCYVNVVVQGIVAIWKSFKNDNYPILVLEDYSELKGRYLRIGSYGDPAAVPVEVWEKLAKYAKGYTGYTHAWHYCNPEYSKYCMASCDTEDQVIKAESKGYKTFRTKLPENDKLSTEVICPASKDNSTITCEKCKLCNASKGKKKNIVIDIHGFSYKVRRFRWALKQKKNKKKFRRIPSVEEIRKTDIK